MMGLFWFSVGKVPLGKTIFRSDRLLIQVLCSYGSRVPPGFVLKHPTGFTGPCGRGRKRAGRGLAANEWPYQTGTGGGAGLAESSENGKKRKNPVVANLCHF